MATTVMTSSSIITAQPPTTTHRHPPPPNTRQPLCASKFFAQTKMRDEFGFEGYVQSDCSAVNNMVENEGWAVNATDAAARRLNGGLMNSNCGGGLYNYICDAIAEGLSGYGSVDETHAKTNPMGTAGEIAVPAFVLNALDGTVATEEEDSTDPTSRARTHSMPPAEPAARSCLTHATHLCTSAPQHLPPSPPQHLCTSAPLHPSTPAPPHLSMYLLALVALASLMSSMLCCG